LNVAATRPAVAALLLFAILAIAQAFAIDFPPLSGRVVDEAGVIPAATRASVEAKLAALEDKSGIQFVVATVKSLGGQAIEPYANQLFRTWRLGEKQKNNGVLLLIAPNERKARIEVGYGLEGTLTDALSKLVIANAIAPRFNAGDFGGGVERGVDDMIAVLTTDSAEWRPRLKVRQDQDEIDWMPLLAFLLILIMFWLSMRNARRGVGRSGPWSRATTGPVIWFPTGGGSSWGGGGGFSGGGGFTGGGGSSGGGGASGGW
jgi:uncharacterized protein